MKYIEIFCDGMADGPLYFHKNKTSMEEADTPCMDALAKYSEIGICKITEHKAAQREDTAVLSVLGYDPSQNSPGHSFLKAYGLDMDIKEDDVVFLADFISLSEEENFDKKTVLASSISDISKNERKKLIQILKSELDNQIFSFHGDSSGENLYLLWKQGEPKIGTIKPPEMIQEKKIGDSFPKSELAAPICHLMQESYHLFSELDLNETRKQEGKIPINAVWLWEIGTGTQLEEFEKRFHLKACVLSDMDYTKGIAKLCGIEPTDSFQSLKLEEKYRNMAKLALEKLKDHDFIFIHINEPKKYAFLKEKENKIRAIHFIDKYIIREMKEVLRTAGEDFKFMILSGHSANPDNGCSTCEPVPYMIYDSRKKIKNQVDDFNEKSAYSTGVFIPSGHLLFQKFLF